MAEQKQIFLEFLPSCISIMNYDENLFLLLHNSFYNSLFQMLSATQGCTCAHDQKLSTWTLFYRTTTCFKKIMSA
jgi:hypothetical protein